jgi:hypothetical protein
MIVPTIDQMQQQVSELTELSKTPSIIYFDEFIKSLSPLYKNHTMPDEIRIAKDEDALLAGDYEPAFVINIKDNLDILMYDDLKMWHNQNNKEFSLHGLGLIEGNRSSPSQFTLYDTNPHGNIGGATGHGKSVLGNDIIMAGALVHPPWLVQYYLSDPKITELKPYATGKVMPHVNTVAATEDPSYAVSMLEYLIEVMNKRASIFERFKVKNIDAFNKSSGLLMPMLVLILDELKAMLLTAGKWSGKIDKLIQEFVAKARFCGGRAILLSQGVVTELDPATMKNINIRVALGCVPAESEKLVGNPGASVNLGTMGKITYNDTPEKKLKQNIYLTSPFLPDTPSPHSRDIYEIFNHQLTVWEKLAGVGARISPLSFFDQTAILTKKTFAEEIHGKVSMERIFLGEPAYINKGKYKMAHINLMPNDKYSDNLGNNILMLSGIAKNRLNFLATMLMNFDELRKTRELDIRIYSPIAETNRTIESLRFQVEGYNESPDVADAFARIVSQIYMKMLVIKTDERVFGGGTIPDNTIFDSVIEFIVENYSMNLSSLMKRRVKVFLEQAQEERSRQVLGLSDVLNKKTESDYAHLAYSFVGFYHMFDRVHTQMTAQNTPVDIRVFFNFHLLQGTEVKTNRNLDLWMSVIKMGPVYGSYVMIISDMLPTSGTSLNGTFNKIIFFNPTNNAVSQQKLTDDFPDSSLPCLVIYADKTKVENKCVKVKFVTMLED